MITVDGPIVPEKSFKAFVGFHFFFLLPPSFPSPESLAVGPLIAVLSRTLFHLLTQ